MRQFNARKQENKLGRFSHLHQMPEERMVKKVY
jgi:hypothetical protein